MIPPLRSTLLLLVAILLATTDLVAQNELRDLVRRAKPGVVTIAVFGENGQPVGKAGGFFVATDRIVTSRHVVERASRLEFRTEAGSIHAVAGIVADLPNADLALLAVEIPEAESTSLALAAAEPEIGDRVIAIGSPYGLELTVSEGIVSSIRPDPIFGTLLQITAPISPGSSGGPILDGEGNVVGVATAVLSEGQNLNFAIPSARIGELLERSGDPVRSFAEWRTESAHDPRQMLGAPPLPDELAKNPEMAAFTARYAMERGTAYFNAGHLEAAVEMLGTAVTIDPSLIRGWMMMGTAELLLEHYDHAEFPLSQALKLDPTHKTLRCQLGEAYLRGGKPEQAEAEYRRVLGADSTFGLAWGGLGVLLVDDPARRDEGLAALHRAVIYDTTISEVWHELGRYYATIEPIRSLDAYMRALRLDPASYAIAADLSALLVSLGRLEPAVKLWETYLSAVRVDAEGTLQLGELLLRLERYDEALPQIRRSIELAPENARAHWALGVTLTSTGKTEEGFRSLVESVRHDPDFAGAHHALGLAYLARGDRPSALDEYRILKDLDPVLAEDLFRSIYE